MPEGFAIPEPILLIETLRREEYLHGTGLETQSLVPAPASDPDDVRQQGPPHSLAPERCRRAHRLDLAMRRIQLLECAATQKPGSFARGPERDVGMLELAHVEGVDAIGWRVRMHVSQVLFQEFSHVGGARIIDCDLHAGALPEASPDIRVGGINQHGKCRGVGFTTRPCLHVPHSLAATLEDPGGVCKGRSLEEANVDMRLE